VLLVPALLVLVLSGLQVGTAGAVTIELPDDRQLDLFFMVQFWNATTLEATDSAGQELTTRSDLYIRRGRFGIKGLFRPDVSYCFNFAYDNIGKDPATGATGGPQASANREFYLWDGFVTVALDPTWAHLTVGYFRPQVGRESITSSFNVNSFTKTLCNSYPRLHIVGRGTGRETGLNLGGLYHADGWGLNYNLGAFDTNHAAIVGRAGTDSHWSPLLTGRLALTLGDAERNRYGLGYAANYFGQRRGITVAVNGTYQGMTNETIADSVYGGGFKRNHLWSVDVLANDGPLNFSYEYHWLDRGFSDEFTSRLLLETVLGQSSETRCSSYTDQVQHFRIGYNFALRCGRVIEPAIMYTRFEGDSDSAVFPAGEHELLSVGLNWYLDRNRWKINLHYAWQDGAPVSAYAKGKEAKGNYLGLGMQLVY
jgi:hypothetical protein